MSRDSGFRWSTPEEKGPEPSLGLPSMTPSERVLRARIGAYALHAKRDPRETTAAARHAFLSKFETEVDPEGILPSAERQRRAEAARKAHFTRLALKSAQARRKRKTDRDR